MSLVIDESDRRFLLGKQATRKSLKPDHARPQMEDATAGIAADSTVNEDVVQEEVLEEVREDTLRASQSPALDDVRELLGSASKLCTSPDDDEASRMDGDEIELRTTETLCGARSIDLREKFTPYDSAPLPDLKEESHLRQGETSSQGEIPRDSLLGSIPPTVPEHSALNTPIEGPSLPVSEAEAVVDNNDFLSQSKLKDATTSPGHTVTHDTEYPSPSQLEGGTIPQEHVVSNAELVPSSSHVATPALASAAKSRRPKQLTDALSPSGSPQIGTSLLRRESLRRKESPTKKRELRKRSPKKRETLSRRDTLQEREILQKVIAETNEGPNADDADHAVVEAAAPSSDDLIARIEQHEHSVQRINSEKSAVEEQPIEKVVTGAESLISASDGATMETDLHRAMEAIEVFVHPTTSDAKDVSISTSDAEAEETKAIDKANGMIAKAELEEATQTVETVQEQTELPARKTRSGARFSDDTSMLRDFLNRAQASKAAKIPILSPLEAPKPQDSPRRSPRKALRTRIGDASTPQKLGDIAHRPGTPPGMPKADMLDSDDAEEMTATPTSCRRSTRTRLPAPSKTPPGAPSFIPVRRADGADPVVLQKSQAQELAIVTRANTRRNKGQSRPPLLALKDLPAELAEPDTARQRADVGKSVGWATTLASYQDPKEEADEVKERKPKVRRMKGLGGVNGTPAPKKTTAVVGTSNGTPARRGKVR